jgi:8-oxo-dGTP pyrophosphatase MutT (NUDIX family)
MYKVFFNDSTIQIGSNLNKSLNNNTIHIAEPEGYEFVNQLVSEIEGTAVPLNYLITSRDEMTIWKQFRKRFNELPAAGGLVRNTEGSFLFIRRFGVWDLPKGKIEKKETPEMAAIREVEEECGISGLQLIRPLDSTWHIYRSPWLKTPENLVLKETKWFFMNYAGNEIPVPELDEDIEEVRWFKPSEVEWVMQHTYSSLADLIRKSLPIIR